MTELQSTGKNHALRAIAAAGLIAGALDLTQACFLFGWDIPLAIAAGLLGRQALHGGVPTYLLGVLLHFFIATSFAAFYYAASRRLTFLTEHPLVCGLFYGAAVEEVMNLVVLPVAPVPMDMAAIGKTSVIALPAGERAFVTGGDAVIGLYRAHSLHSPVLNFTLPGQAQAEARRMLALLMTPPAAAPSAGNNRASGLDRRALLLGRRTG